MSDVDRSLSDHQDQRVSAPDTPGRSTSVPRAAHPNQASPRWWLVPLVTAVAGVALLVLFTWQVVVRGPLIAWDWPLHEYVESRQPSGVGRWLLNSIASLGGQRLYTLPILVGVGAWVAWKQQSIRVLVAIGAGLATVFVVGYWMKYDLGRTSPFTGTDTLDGGQAFPSGHAANAALTWTLIVIILFGARGLRPSARLFRRSMIAAGLLIFVSGMLMTLLDYHWFSDIPGGWCLGALALAVSNAILRGPIPWERIDSLLRRGSERH